MRERFARTIGVAALSLGLALPLGTVLCVHDGGHASLEAAGLGRCGDDHDAAGHDTSSHEATSPGDREAPCMDTVVDGGELKSAPASDFGLLASAALSGLSFYLPPTASDPTGAAYSSVAETSRWVTASDAALRTTVVLC